MVVDDFIHNIKEKQAAWWSERLHGNAFEIRNRFSREGNCGAII